MKNPSPPLASYERLGSNPMEVKPVQLDYFRPIRPKIIHLLIWTILAALLLGLDFSLDLNLYGALGQHQELMRICRIVVDIILAALLVGGGVLWIDGIRKKKGNLQPGHWIVAISAFECSATWLIFYGYRRSTGELLLHPNRTNLAIAWTVILCLICLLYLWAAQRTIGRKLWKWALSVLAYRYFFEGLLVLSHWTGLVFFYACTAAVYFLYAPIVGLLVAATIGDFSKGLRCDWLHRFGVAALLTMMILYDVILGLGLNAIHW